MDEKKIKKDLLMQLMKEMSDLDMKKFDPEEDKAAMIEVEVEAMPKSEMVEKMSDAMAKDEEMEDEDTSMNPYGKKRKLAGKNLKEQLARMK